MVGDRGEAGVWAMTETFAVEGIPGVTHYKNGLVRGFLVLLL